MIYNLNFNKNMRKMDRYTDKYETILTADAYNTTVL